MAESLSETLAHMLAACVVLMALGAATVMAPLALLLLSFIGSISLLAFVPLVLLMACALCGLLLCGLGLAGLMLLWRTLVGQARAMLLPTWRAMWQAGSNMLEWYSATHQTALDLSALLLPERAPAPIIHATADPGPAPAAVAAVQHGSWLGLSNPARPRVQQARSPTSVCTPTNRRLQQPRQATVRHAGSSKSDSPCTPTVRKPPPAVMVTQLTAAPDAVTAPTLPTLSVPVTPEGDTHADTDARVTSGVVPHQHDASASGSGDEGVLAVPMHSVCYGSCSPQLRQQASWSTLVWSSCFVVEASDSDVSVDEGGDNGDKDGLSAASAKCAAIPETQAAAAVCTAAPGLSVGIPFVMRTPQQASSRAHVVADTSSGNDSDDCFHFPPPPCLTASQLSQLPRAASLFLSPHSSTAGAHLAGARLSHHAPSASFRTAPTAASSRCSSSSSLNVLATASTRNSSTSGLAPLTRTCSSASSVLPGTGQPCSPTPSAAPPSGSLPGTAAPRTAAPAPRTPQRPAPSAALTAVARWPSSSSLATTTVHTSSNQVRHSSLRTSTGNLHLDMGSAGSQGRTLTEASRKHRLMTRANTARI